MKGEEKSRMRNRNRVAYQQPMNTRGLEPVAEGPAPVAEAPRIDSSWGGSLSPR